MGALPETFSPRSFGCGRGRAKCSYFFRKGTNEEGATKDSKNTKGKARKSSVFICVHLWLNSFRVFLFVSFAPFVVLSLVADSAALSRLHRNPSNRHGERNFFAPQGGYLAVHDFLKEIRG